MASYRLIELNAYWVELAIIGSIVFVAINSLWQIYRPWKTVDHCDVALTPSLFDATVVWIFLFGLLHGLGFASSLQALQIPTDHFLISLLGFNLGVEVAQIGFCSGRRGHLRCAGSTACCSSDQAGVVLAHCSGRLQLAHHASGAVFDYYGRKSGRKNITDSIMQPQILR